MNAVGGGEHKSIGDEAARAEPGVVDVDVGVVGKGGTSLGIAFHILALLSPTARRDSISRNIAE